MVQIKELVNGTHEFVDFERLWDDLNDIYVEDLPDTCIELLVGVPLHLAVIPEKYFWNKRFIKECVKQLNVLKIKYMHYMFCGRIIDGILDWLVYRMFICGIIEELLDVKMCGTFGTIVWDRDVVLGILNKIALEKN